MSEPIVMAFDLGGTDLKAARVTRAGVVRGFKRIASRASEGEGPLFEAITAAAEQLGGPAGPAIAGFGSPGAIHPETGALLEQTPHVKLPANFPLAQRLALALRTRVAVANDANCAALAEHAIGAAKGARVSIMITVGTGVGCGVIVDGKIFSGAFGGAGEMGHLPLGGVAESGGHRQLENALPVCRCGVSGCLEPLAGGAGLLAQARAAGMSVENVRDVFESSLPKAGWLIDRMTTSLAMMVGAAVNLLNPDVVVIGGGVAQAGDRLMVPLRQKLERFTLASHRRGMRLEASALGEQAGVIGAGLLAWAEGGPVPRRRKTDNAR